MVINAITVACIAFVSTFLGGLVSLRFKDKLHYLMSFTAGVILGVVFFEIIPEIFNLVSEEKLGLHWPLWTLIGGFLFIHFIEKSVVIHHSHEGQYASHHHPHVGLVSSLGLVFHSFLDGIGIGLGYAVNPAVGLVVAIAVIAHDFSDGLNTVTLMLINKNSSKRAVILLGLDAIAPVLGVLSTMLFTIPANVLVLYLGFFAGFLLYLSAADLLPEAHSKKSSYSLIALTLLGALFIFVVTQLV